MRKILMLLLCMQCTWLFAQTSPTPFTNCPDVYVIGYKDGTNCIANPFSVYTMSLSGSVHPTPLFTTSTTQEVNGIGISKVDGKGYALLFDRMDGGPTGCYNTNVNLIRFGANGARETIGIINAPTGGSVITALGCVDASDNYYFGASTATGFYLGKISNISSLAAGTMPTISYQLVGLTCPAIFADWAISPADGNLYTYGTYNNGGVSTGSLMKLDLSTNAMSCYGTQNSTEFTSTSQDNFAGIMFGSDGFLYGMNVFTRRYYKIDPATGSLTLVNTIPGGGQLRGDLASCASYQPPTSFNCPNAYLIGYKNGTNCTANPFGIYTMDLAGNVAATPVLTTSTTQEANGIGIAKTDGKGYAMLYDRITVGSSCAADNIKLIRFGANGTTETLGTIPPPAGGIVATAIGTIDANGTYLFLAYVGTQYYIGKIANLQSIPAGSTLTPVYSAITTACTNTIYADWAYNAGDGNLYTYGIYSNGGVSTGTLMKLDMTTNTISCYGNQNSTEFTNIAQDNFGGIMFGADGFLYGVNVFSRKFYKINIANGDLTNVSTIPGGGQLRGDMASCVTSLPPVPFTTCPNVYVIGYKNGTNCTANPFGVYNMNLAGDIATSPIFTTGTTSEANAIGISKTDGFGYAMLYDRITAGSSCAADNINLIRFGSNGGTTTIGLIPPPPGGTVATAIGVVDASGTYLFLAYVGTQYYIGKISNISSLTAGSTITPVYSTINAVCNNTIYADWAYNANDGNLYTYGIYSNGGVSTGTMMKLDLTTNTLNCYGNQNSTEFTNVVQDNFGGVMFGSDGFLYGVNVFSRKFYKIDIATGNLTYVSTVPGGGQLRGDMASCASSVPPTAFTTCPDAYLIGYKNGTNCIASPFGVYTMSLSGTVSPTALFTTSTTQEVNGLAISKADGKGYALMFDRLDGGPLGCYNANVNLIRFGANGSKEIIGTVNPPAGGVLITALGCTDASGNYYFGATVGTSFYLGKISNIGSLAAGSTLTPVYTLVSASCTTVFADWAYNANDNSLYTYGIYSNGGVSIGTLQKLDLATYTLTCFGDQNGTEFTSVTQDNFAGIMFGSDGYLYGMNVLTCKYYKINPATGALELVNVIPGSGQLRGDMASCVTSIPVAPFNCPSTYVTAFKNGFNCTADEFKVYAIDPETGISASPIMTTPDNVELNGIGISTTDSKGYALRYNRLGNALICTSDTVKLIRFGANGASESLGYILPPPGGTIGTALGAVNAGGTYLFGANVGMQYYLGKIYNVQNLVSGNTQLTVVYQLVTNNCNGKIFSDWAVSPDNGKLYTYGIYLNGLTTTGTLMVLDTTTLTLTCAGMPNTTQFKNILQDNFAGIMFGSNGFLYGVNANTRKVYRINPVTGIALNIYTLAGSGQLRGDMGSCAGGVSNPIAKVDNLTIKADGGCQALVSWKNDGMKLTSPIDIEKSYDGITFFMLETLPAGSSANYITDAKPGITTFYRIKTTEFDGSVNYVATTKYACDCNKDNRIVIFDNPLTGNQLKGEIALVKSQTVVFNVLNGAGTKIFSTSQVMNAGASRFGFSLPAAGKGVYLLQTIIGNERINRKFVMQ